MTTVTQKRQDGLEALEDAIKEVQENVQLIKGVCNVHMEVSN
jgi:hypothetical protein